mmetsp:Transcript_20133/g.37852  ORF Transcript_20133/g.37852 Transcript_20133/m.37852 type:complete len:90 (+) Transcript_20133:999-1268(+)
MLPMPRAVVDAAARPALTMEEGIMGVRGAAEAERGTKADAGMRAAVPRARVRRSGDIWVRTVAGIPRRMDERDAVKIPLKAWLYIQFFR